jgi:hypothetical protein
MTCEESAIVIFLQGFPSAFVARKEIARKAVKRKTFEEDPHWADGALASLLNQGIIEQNDSAQYRLRKS